MTTADVVFVPILDAVHGDDLADLPTDDGLRAALLAAGWRVDGEPLPAPTPTSSSPMERTFLVPVCSKPFAASETMETP